MIRLRFSTPAYVGRSPHIGSYKVGYPQNVRLVSHTTFSEALVFEREQTSRRSPIVLGTFTSSSRKFVDLSYRSQTGEAALTEKMFYGACLNWNEGVDKS